MCVCKWWVSEKPIDGIRRGEIWLMDVIWACGRSVAGKWRQKLSYDEICPFCLVHHISHTTIFFEKVHMPCQWLCKENDDIQTDRSCKIGT